MTASNRCTGPGAVAAIMLIGLTGLTTAACDRNTSPKASEAGDAHALAPVSATRMAQDPRLWAQRFQQQSARIKALQIQAYNVARRRLDAALAVHEGPRRPAVILDLDETVLDNAAYGAAGVDYGFHFPAHWAQWVAAAKAPLIPGARAFLDHADARDVAIFYVSNRKRTQAQATIENMQRLGLPQARLDHLRLQGPDKTTRRHRIARDHDILLLVGDTLHDFSAAFADDSLARRRAGVDRLADQFGTRFIVLPNAGYGAWHSAPLLPWRPPDAS